MNDISPRKIKTGIRAHCTNHENSNKSMCCCNPAWNIAFSFDSAKKSCQYHI